MMLAVLGMACYPNLGNNKVDLSMHNLTRLICIYIGCCLSVDEVSGSKTAPMSGSASGSQK